MTLRRSHPGRTGAFTLMELLLALAISVIVISAISGVFFGALRLRDRTTRGVEAALPINQTLSVLRRDLEGALGPSNGLAGDFLCAAPSMGVKMGLGSSAGVGIDFFTTTGIISDDAPWGDLQEVYYQLADPEERTSSQGRDLVRYVNRNLLATTTPTPEEQRLLSNVDRLDFECFDGLQWRPNWDTTQGDTNLPMAVRVRIQLVTDKTEDAREVHPLEMIVALVGQTAGQTNTIAQSQ